MAATEPRLRQESTGDLVRRLLDDIQGLVDRQIALVKQEVREEVQQLVGATRTLGIGAALLLLALISFFDFLFHGIDRLFPGWGWVAALVLTLIFGFAGALLAKKGAAKVKVEPLTRTRETLKEDAEWAKHRLTLNGKSNHSETTSHAQSRRSSGEPVA
jgi:uncharacterized membrane protein YqjE